MTALPKLIVITGPTASGKSALAIEMAQKLNTEVISADSRQIYKGIPIATAVPGMDERCGVRHHLMECLSLDAYYSAAMFADDALSIARRLWAEGHGEVIVCGGSMMYIDALCDGIDELPDIPEDLRRRLADQWQAYGDEWLLAELALVDPVCYAGIDRRNMKRVFHAVEVTRAAGKPYSSLLTGRKKAPEGFTIERHVIDLPRQELFERINRRVEAMAEAGLLEEARSVYHLRHLNSLNTVGLKEMFRVIEGEWDLDFALARMAKNTRVYAKKQITWLKPGGQI